MALFPAQAVGVSRFLDQIKRSGLGRFILAWGTGTGKTIAAIEAMRHVKPRTCLIVCPAVVRWHWLHELEKWAPDLALKAGIIEIGKGRSSATLRAKRARDEALASPIQIVSYDLLSEVASDGWEMVIIDEAHHLANPLSQQSLLMAEKLRQCPSAHILALSATLIPTEVKQLWHILHLLQPYKWGKPSRTGGISWHFASRYCTIKKNGYGTAIVGANHEAMPELRSKLMTFTHELCRGDISESLPQLDVRKIAFKAPSLMQASLAWVNSQPPDVRKLVVFAHDLAIVGKTYHTLWAVKDSDGEFYRVVHIDGSTPFAERARLLQELEAEQRKCILVASSGSLLEGVRLAWADRVLITQWDQSPARVVQLLGRFMTVASAHKPVIEVFVPPEKAGQADNLLRRVGDINTLLKAGPTENIIEQVFRVESLNDDQLKCHLHSLLLGWNSDAQHFDGSEGGNED